jgi:putative hydrolases of HD superfamily
VTDGREIEQTLAFLRAAEALKNQTRTAWMSTGKRESVAEHTWRLCLMAVALQGQLGDIDVARLLKICIVHDLGEAIGGDISARVQAQQRLDDPDAPHKSAQEREQLLQVVAPLPQSARDEIVALWDEYEAATTREARVAKGLDKLETILQHNQGANPTDFDYGFNLDYGREYTSADPLLAAIRKLLDAETRERASLQSSRGA